MRQHHAAGERMFVDYAGVTLEVIDGATGEVRQAQVVSDNLKSGVTRACFHEPAADRTYADLAEHYGAAVVPARPLKPRDKAQVEVAVQIVQRWIAARLRNQRFFSLPELNAAIRVLLDRLNDARHKGSADACA
jgi:transposase